MKIMSKKDNFKDTINRMPAANWRFGKSDFERVVFQKETTTRH